MKKKKSLQNIRWTLVVYDLIIYAVVSVFFLRIYKGIRTQTETAVLHVLICGACLFLTRFIAGIYRLIWRYGGVQSYMRLIISEAVSFLFALAAERIFVPSFPSILLLVILTTDLLLALSMRMTYRYIYKCGSSSTAWGRFLCGVLRVFSFDAVKAVERNDANRIIVAIAGAGNTGISLAEEMNLNPNSPYIVRCFIDTDKGKAGREIHDLPVYAEDENTDYWLRQKEVQEIIFALPRSEQNTLQGLYKKYIGLGYKVKTYDYPVMANAGSGKRVMREFDIEDLLFRKQVEMENEQAAAFYKNKVILITGGGGSIGSELCRQLAKMGPKRIIIVDIYENGAYDVQQELRIRYGAALDVRIHIVSFTNKPGLERIFEKYRPEIVINAAAHKHVPLMENDCIEAVENNVFGTLNTVELSEKYGVKRFIQVSTDKAVNPTNVMGATKRVCEFIIHAHSASGTATTFSATRFGNVLGSAGSVIPLFKRQIANGGPVTVTDKRVIRYFMTIPEASQLVLQSGAMAKNGELFVLDMGKPVKIYDLAESMIRLSGMAPGSDIKIIETGLRPGEKLYEELLIQSEQLSKTENELIFVEKDAPVSMELLEEKLERLKAAIETGIEDNVKWALAEVVPTFKPMTVSRTDIEVFENEPSNAAAPDLPEEIKDRSVLIVDDLSINREIAADTLTELGMRTDTAAGGAEALDKVKQNTYDYVLMDIVMPGMDGYEAAKQIKALRPALPVIAMTAESSEENKEKALAAGMSAYISKPMHLDELLAAMIRQRNR